MVCEHVSTACFTTATSHERHGVSNHRQLDFFAQNFFQSNKKKLTMLHINGPLRENPLVTGGSPHNEHVIRRAFPRHNNATPFPIKSWIIMTSWNGNPRYWSLCEGNPSVTGGFPSRRANNVGLRSSFVASLNKRSNKHSIHQHDGHVTSP